MSLGIIAAIAVGTLLAGLVIGFLLGTRGRQVMHAVAHLREAMRPFSLKIPTASIDMGAASSLAKAAAAANAAAQPSSSTAETAVEEPGVGPPRALLDTYLSHAPSALDDHPDVTINPILRYQIQREKERLRQGRKREALKAQLGDAAATMTEEELHESLRELELTGAAHSYDFQQTSAMKVLLSHGARFTAVRSDSSEAAALAERRRLARNVETYLVKAFDLEGIRKDVAPKRPLKSKEGVRLKSAYDVANETLHTPHAVHGSLLRAHRTLDYAKDGRERLRGWEARRRMQRLRDGLPPFEGGSDSDSEGDGGNAKAKRAKAVRAMPGAEQIAALQLEFADDQDEDDRNPSPLADEESRLAAWHAGLDSTLAA